MNRSGRIPPDAHHYSKLEQMYSSRWTGMKVTLGVALCVTKRGFQYQLFLEQTTLSWSLVRLCTCRDCVTREGPMKMHELNSKPHSAGLQTATKMLAFCNIFWDGIFYNYSHICDLQTFFKYFMYKNVQGVSLHREICALQVDHSIHVN